MPKVKICGITSVADALSAAEAGADYIGLVFAESPRRVAPATAAEIAREIRGFPVKIAGVFVNEEENTVKRTVQKCSVSTLQFHGEETPGYCLKFAGFEVFKAFRLASPEDALRIRLYSVDAHLVDAFVEGKRGGTGKTLPGDLADLAAFEAERLFLSGGLNPANVRALIERIHPYGVDVSSGVERTPGVKDPEKIRLFLKNARREDNASG